MFIYLLAMITACSLPVEKANQTPAPTATNTLTQTPPPPSATPTPAAPPNRDLCARLPAGNFDDDAPRVTVQITHRIRIIVFLLEKESL
jgi:hypothetical protein